MRAAANMALWPLVALTAWLAWTAAMNLPLLPDGLGPVEAFGWPFAVLAASAALVSAIILDFSSTTTLLPLASLLIAAIIGALALRLTLLPLHPGVHPLALVGVRETLGVFAVIYMAFALLSRKGRS